MSEHGEDGPDGFERDPERDPELSGEARGAVIDPDDPLADAVEEYITLADGGDPPDPEEFAARYPEIRDELISALEGLSLVRGLVGSSLAGLGGSRLEAGKRLGGYRIVRELGRGGMGVVYDAVHVGLDRPVALKVLGAHILPDTTSWRRFFNEARTAAELHHTHIVPVFDVGTIGSLCYYAMQRIEGTGLDRVIKLMRKTRPTACGASNTASSRLWRSRSGSGPSIDTERTITWTKAGNGLPSAPHAEDDGPVAPFDPPRGGGYFRWAASLGADAADALEHAHHKGTVHRDIKPSNLLVDARGDVWVADFGLARRQADPGLTLREDVIGTPRYMSPEQAEGLKLDHRTDIYSLGATLYELAALRPPFDGAGAAELARQIRTREPAPPRQSEPRLPRDLETIILKAMAKRPADRYASAGALRDDLLRFLRHEPVRARRISPAGRLWRFARRHPGISAVSTAATAAVLATVTLAYFRVVAERDRALTATGKSIVRELSTLRFSTAPNRREHAAALVKEALAIRGAESFRTQLRDESLEILAGRDVADRGAIATGYARGVLLTTQAPRERSARLATLSQDGDRLEIRDVDTGAKIATRSLAPVSGRSEIPPPTMGRRIAAIGPDIVALETDGKTIQVINGATGELKRRLATPGDRLVSIHSSPRGRRFVTVEQSAPRPDPGGREPAVIARRGDPPPNRSEDDDLDPTMGDDREVVRMTVRVWKYDDSPSPLTVLDSWEDEVGGRVGPMFPPLVTVDADGRRIALARWFGDEIRIWSAEDRRPFVDPSARRHTALKSPAPITAIAFGPRAVLAAAGGGMIRLWDVDTSISLPAIRTNEGTILLLRFNPRGNLIAVAGWGHDFELWDATDQSYAPVARFTTSDWVHDLAFSPDDKKLAVAGSKDAVDVWEVIEPVGRFRLGETNVTPAGIAFRSDGKLLALGTWDGSLRLWGLDPEPGPAMAWRQRGEGFLVESGRPQPMPRNQSRGLASRRDDPPSKTPAQDLPLTTAFGPEGDLITMTQATILRCPEARMPWGGMFPDLRRPIRTDRPAQVRSEGMLTPIAADLHGKLVVAICGSEMLIRGGGPEGEMTRHPLAFTKTFGNELAEAEHARGPGDGPVLAWWRIAVTTEKSGKRRIYAHYVFDRKTSHGPERRSALARFVYDGKTVVQDVSWSEPAEFSAFAIAPDGGLIAVGEKSGAVRILRAEDGKPFASLPRDGDAAEPAVEALAFRPGKPQLAVGAAGAVRLWSLEAGAGANPQGGSGGVIGRPLAKLPGSRASLTSLGFRPQGDLLAGAWSDNQVVLWKLDAIREGLAKLGLDWREP